VKTYSTEELEDLLVNINIKVDGTISGQSGVGSGVESELARQILSILVDNPLSKSEIARQLGKSKPSRYLNELVAYLLQKGFVEYTIPGKPNSRLQKYRLKANGGKLETYKGIQNDKT